MTDRVVVLGAGYAGTGAVTALENQLADADITWVSEHDYHLVLHEVHRVIRDPDAEEAITVPIEEIKSPDTTFIQGRVDGIDTGDRVVKLADDSEIDYDYLLVALGSSTAFYGIPGLEEHAHTLKGLDDAHAIHDAVRDAAADATPGNPARVLIGGGGISGIQIAGEIAEYRDSQDASIDITLVEALEEIMPGRDPDLQHRVRRRLDANGIEILTDDPVTEATDEVVRFDERGPIEHDVLVWAGGVTGRDALEESGVDANHNRVMTDATFRTSDERVFAVGDSASIEVDGISVPPTAQAAWDAADVAAANIARVIQGRPLRTWSYEDKGTVLSVGEAAIAHDVMYSPIETFESLPARVLKKVIGVRWLASVTSLRRALSAWPVL
ncbi:MAG: NAD(P)/FAD-dependent oxidoreductase [Halobacteriales archaeon]